MGNSIKPHLEHAQKTGVCNLAKQDLPELPEGLQSLNKNLRTLDVSENKISILPSYIGTFGQLKILNIGKNRISSLPAEIGQLVKLETLLANNNRLMHLPGTLSNLRSLRDVSLASNQLKSFPTHLCALKNLSSLDLSHNKITEIPPEVKGLSVVELNCNRNQISQMSDCVADCPNLKVLRLEENCLPLSSFTPKVLRDSAISLLAVDGNVFDMKDFRTSEGYDQYMERYTATKKKFN